MGFLRVTWSAPAPTQMPELGQCVAQLSRKYSSQNDQTWRRTSGPCNQGELLSLPWCPIFAEFLCLVYFTKILHDQRPFFSFFLFLNSSLFLPLSCLLPSLLSNHLTPLASWDIIQSLLNQKLLFTTQFISHILLAVVDTSLPSPYKVYLFFICHHEKVESLNIYKLFQTCNTLLGNLFLFQKPLENSGWFTVHSGKLDHLLKLTKSSLWPGHFTPKCVSSRYVGTCA